MQTVLDIFNASLHGDEISEFESLHNCIFYVLQYKVGNFLLSL